MRGNLQTGHYSLYHSPSNSIRLDRIAQNRFPSPVLTARKSDISLYDRIIQLWTKSDTTLLKVSDILAGVGRNNSHSSKITHCYRTQHEHSKVNSNGTYRILSNYYFYRCPQASPLYLIRSNRTKRDRTQSFSTHLRRRKNNEHYENQNRSYYP